jgi:O-acetylserine/cysteine efflux transporter
MNSRELTLLLAMCVVWGFHYVVLKTGVGEIPPTLYAAMRMTLVAALLAPFLRWRAGEMLKVLVAGFCFGFFNYLFLFNGVARATASASAIAIELYVPFATILSIIFLGERIGWKRTLGIALAFAGVAIVAVARDPSADGKIGIGVGLVAACAMTEAIGAILVKRISGFKAHELLAWFALVGAVLLWPTAVVLEGAPTEALRAADGWLVAGAVAYSAIGASIFGHTAYYWLLQRLPVSLVAPSTLLTTLLGVAFSAIWLGERMTAPFIAGALTTLVGVAIVLLRTPRGRAIETGGAETVGLAPEPAAEKR